MELTVEQKREILARCEENIDNFKELCRIAYDRIGKLRCDLGSACEELLDGMRGEYEGWCYDNDIEPDYDFDVEEELFFFDDPYEEEVTTTYYLSAEQQQVIIDALRDRIGKMYDMAESYVGNTDAKKDCHAEAQRAKKVLEEFLAM